MKYINRLTDEQIKELIYLLYSTETVKDIRKELEDDYLEIEIDIKLFLDDMTKEEIETTDTLEFRDFGFRRFSSYDFSISQEKIKSYKMKMYEFFGNDYSMDYMLNN